MGKFAKGEGGGLNIWWRKTVCEEERKTGQRGQTVGIGGQVRDICCIVLFSFFNLN